MNALNAVEWPRHKGGLHIMHNQHAAYYETVETALANGHTYEPEDFESANAIAECKATGSVWSIQWYPDTPIGSFQVHAPTLAAALAFALAVQAADDERRP